MVCQTSLLPQAEAWGSPKKTCETGQMVSLAYSEACHARQHAGPTMKFRSTTKVLAKHLPTYYNNLMVDCLSQQTAWLACERIRP